MKDFAILLSEFEGAATVEEREEIAWLLWYEFGFDVYGEDRDDPFPTQVEDVEAWAR